MYWKTINKPCKKLLTSTGGASSGRNNAGRITIWHRGGGSKRLHRNVDMKRDTPSVGIVERIEYDPNRSSKIALVRWTEGVRPIKPREHFTPSHKLAHGPIATTVSGQFPLSFITANNGMTNQERVGSKIGSLKDVFISAFTSSGLKQVSSLNVPRFAVAGARPAVFALQQRGETKAEEEKNFALSDVQRWKKDSILWAHRSKRKAAVSWHSVVGRDMPLGFVKTDEDEEMIDQGHLLLKPTGQTLKTKGRTPISYILSSHELEVGQMVMNYDPSKPPRNQSHF